MNSSAASATFRLVHVFVPAFTALSIAGCGGGGSGGGGSVEPPALVRPIDSQRLVSADDLRISFAHRWSDGGLATFATQSGVGNGGLIGFHHGESGEIDWSFRQNSLWSFANTAGLGTNEAWFTWVNETALVARIAPNGTIAAQSEITVPDGGLVATVVDGDGNAYFIGGDEIARLDSNASPVWAYRIESTSAFDSNWHAVDPEGGIVFGVTLDSGAVRAASLAPDGTVRWSRELRGAVDTQIYVHGALVDTSHATTLLVETNLSGAPSIDDIALFRIAADGTLTTESLRPSGVLPDVWYVRDFVEVDGGAKGWVVALIETNLIDTTSLDLVRVDEHGGVRWSRRADATGVSQLEIAPYSDGGLAVVTGGNSTDRWSVSRLNAAGESAWTRSVELSAAPLSALVRGDGDATRLEPRAHGPFAPRSTQRSSSSASTAPLGLSLVDSIAREDGGLTLSLGAAPGRLFVGLNASGATEWTANAGVLQFVQITRAPGAVAYATGYDQQTGFYHLMRFAPLASQRWKAQSISFGVPLPTTGGGVVLPQTIEEAGDAVVSWLSFESDGTTDATCLPAAIAMPAADLTIESASTRFAPFTHGSGPSYVLDPFVLEATTLHVVTSADVTSAPTLSDELCPL